MTYKLHITRRAERDRDLAFEWYRTNYSQSFAVKWYRGVSRTIRELASNPLRFGVARENESFSFELREVFYGRSRLHRHRVLFTIEDDTVHVLHIRHSAQDGLTEEDV